MHHSDFVATLAAYLKPNVYLELGLYEGETFKKVLPYTNRAIGVDKELKISNIGELYQCSTDEFFQTFTGKVDMVFIDADHQFESAKLDFENSLNILNPGGLVIFHDTDPNEDKLIHPGYCGDSYKLVDYLESSAEYNIITLPIEPPGLSIVTRKQDTRRHRRWKVG